MSQLGRDLGKTGPFELLEQEAYLNLARTSARLSAPIFKLFKSAGLSEATYNLLRILRGAHMQGKQGGVRSTELGKQMVVRVPDVTRLVDRMVEKGFAARERCGEDRRVVFVKITPTGLEVLDRLSGPLLELHRQQFGHMSREQIEQLSALLYLAGHPPTNDEPEHEPRAE